MEYWKNAFKKWANERNFQANLEEYESDVLDQTLSQFYAFRNSVILPSVIALDPRQIKDEYHLSFQKLLTLPLFLCDLGNFSNF